LWISFLRTASALESWTILVAEEWRISSITKNSLKVEVLKGDLKNLKEAEKAVKDVDVVFHYAANPEVRVSTTNPEIHFNENVVATFNLLEAMRKNDIEELIFASSSSVYGEPEIIPVSEDAPIQPVSVYGASKAACENLIHAYSKLYGIKALVLRYANVVGPRLRHGVIYDFLVKLNKNPIELEILGDGTQKRSYIYIDDAVEATLTAYNRTVKQFDVFNVGSEDCLTVKEVADIVIKSMGLKNVRYTYKSIAHGVGWKGDVKHVALNITKLVNLGFKPKMNSVRAVERTTKHLLNEIKNIC
jgi:UDP-glucose 4-epimerase